MNKIPVFFVPEMVADSKSLSPSSAKPPAVVAEWVRAFGDKIDVRSFDPVTPDQLKLVHEAGHVDGILSGRRKNGFGNTCPIIAATLPYTNGAMLAAAREALSNKKVAVAPVSGFHHASTNTAEGFCTFNGLMVTAAVLKIEGLARNVGILDLDCHYGNGTDEIISRLNAHDWMRHFTGGKYYQTRRDAGRFFKDLPTIMALFRDCDLVLYQAGADPHVDDPFGGWMTTGEMKERDGLVFEYLAKHGIPCAWDLAGGYQVEPDGSIPKVLEIHSNTMDRTVHSYLGSGTLENPCSFEVGAGKGAFMVTYPPEVSPVNWSKSRNAHLFCGIPTYEEALEKVFKGRKPVAIYDGGDSECYGLLVFEDGSAYRLYGSDLGVWSEVAHNPTHPFTSLAVLMKEADLSGHSCASYIISLEADFLKFSESTGKGVLTLHVSNLTEDDLEMVTHPLGFNYLSEHINYFTGFLEPFKDYVDRVTFSP